MSLEQNDKMRERILGIRSSIQALMLEAGHEFMGLEKVDYKTRAFRTVWESLDSADTALKNAYKELPRQ